MSDEFAERGDPWSQWPYPGMTLERRARLEKWVSERVGGTCDSPETREARRQKNLRYVKSRLRQHPERTIRNILKALSTMDEPTCCENLRKRDLEGEALERIIRPFDVLGLHFSVVLVSDKQFTVDIGEADGLIGSGGRFLLEQLADGSFRVLETLSEWIA